MRCCVARKWKKAAAAKMAAEMTGEPAAPLIVCIIKLHVRCARRGCERQNSVDIDMKTDDANALMKRLDTGMTVDAGTVRGWKIGKKSGLPFCSDKCREMAEGRTE